MYGAKEVDRRIIISVVIEKITGYFKKKECKML